MKTIGEIIDSGLLEAYALGCSSKPESLEVEEMLVYSPEVRRELDMIVGALEEYAESNAIVPDITIKPFIFATIDYTERMQNGEAPSFPPTLHEGSKLEDYADWLNRSDMIISPHFKDFQAKIIGYTPEVLTAIVWIKDKAPAEMHIDEYEKFLVVEGTCTIAIENDVYALGPGDNLSIPLFKNHRVQVTSSIPCKVILQRIAA